MRQLPLAQRIAVMGVWAPAIVIALLGAIMFVVGSMSQIPSRLFGMPFLAFIIIIIAAHAWVASALLGLVLVVARRSIHPKLTLFSAAIGILLGVPVLAKIYFASIL